MIFIFTDFGREGPYLGQVEAALMRRAPGVPVIHLISDLPAFDPKPAAYLLDAYRSPAEVDDVILAVVDPGVGSDRAGAIVLADGRWYVGPDNGLFAIVTRRATAKRAWRLPPAGPAASATFHGRDVFAPVAAALALKGIAAIAETNAVEFPAVQLDRAAWPDDLAEIVYFDRYGNALTGIRVTSMPVSASLNVAGGVLPRARTFADQPVGTAFWYGNSNGLVEIAVNSGRASDLPGVTRGTGVIIDAVWNNSARGL